MDQPSNIIKSGPSITDRMGGLIKNYNAFVKGNKVNNDPNIKTKYNNPKHINKEANIENNNTELNNQPIKQDSPEQ